MAEGEETKTEEKPAVSLAVGRRKTSVARVRVKAGQGRIMVNKRDYKEYFKDVNAQKVVESPLRAIEAPDRFDVTILVDGGGYTGQAGAIKLGLARALCSIEKAYLDALKAGGFLTRDSRMKERKKYGQRGARRRFQFSKR